MKKLYILLLLSTLLAACVREQVVVLKGNPLQKTALVSLLCPQETEVKVFVSKTQNINEVNATAAHLVSDATVLLSNETTHQQITLTLKSAGLYTCSQSDFPIVAGQTYKITALQNGMEQVQGTTTVPLRVALWGNTYISHDATAVEQSFTGSWAKLPMDNINDYAVNIINHGEPTDLLKENIKEANGIYTVNRSIYISKTESTLVSLQLYTMDTNMSSYATQTDLSYYISDIAANKSFFDLLGIFKGVVPAYSNVHNGVGIIGSYQKDIREMTFLNGL